MLCVCGSGGIARLVGWGVCVREGAVITVPSLLSEVLLTV